MLAKFIVKPAPGPKARLAPGRAPDLFILTEMIRKDSFRKDISLAHSSRGQKSKARQPHLCGLMRVPMVGSQPNRREGGGGDTENRETVPVRQEVRGRGRGQTCSLIITHFSKNSLYKNINPFQKGFLQQPSHLPTGYTPPNSSLAMLQLPRASNLQPTPHQTIAMGDFPSGRDQQKGAGERTI